MSEELKTTDFENYMKHYYELENKIDKLLSPLMEEHWLSSPIGEMCELPLLFMAKYCKFNEDVFVEMAGRFSLEKELVVDVENNPVIIKDWKDFYDVFMQSTPLVQED